MKIGRLKRQADGLADDALAERRQYKSHAHESLVILRRRVGSAAGLATSFSVGFIAGSVTGRERKGHVEPGPDGATQANYRRDSGFLRNLAQGPIGESAIRLGSAMIASSLMKMMRADDRPSVTDTD